jgi:hypothetical protein
VVYIFILIVHSLVIVKNKTIMNSNFVVAHNTVTEGVFVAQLCQWCGNIGLMNFVG